MLHSAVSPRLDDAELRPGSCAPPEWVSSLAYLKAWSVLEHAGGPEGAAGVLGADTVVIKGDDLIGQARSEDEARAIIRRLEEGEHEVVTGVALVSNERRVIFHDSARVRVGRIGDDAIDTYVASGEWKGKAGAYNLGERIEAGWPITYEGDPTCIMGLPMERLSRVLERWGRVGGSS